MKVTILQSKIIYILRNNTKVSERYKEEYTYRFLKFFFSYVVSFKGINKRRNKRRIGWMDYLFARPVYYPAAVKPRNEQSGTRAVVA